jgi:hypothetical protein
MARVIGRVRAIARVKVRAMARAQSDLNPKPASKVHN